MYFLFQKYLDDFEAPYLLFQEKFELHLLNQFLEFRHLVLNKYPYYFKYIFLQWLQEIRQFHLMLRSCLNKLYYYLEW